MQKSIGDPSEPWCRWPLPRLWGNDRLLASPGSESAPTLTEVARMPRTVLARLEAESRGPSQSPLSLRRRPALPN